MQFRVDTDTFEANSEEFIMNTCVCILRVQMYICIRANRIGVQITSVIRTPVIQTFFYYANVLSSERSIAWTS